MLKQVDTALLRKQSNNETSCFKPGSPTSCRGGDQQSNHAASLSSQMLREWIQTYSATLQSQSSSHVRCGGDGPQCHPPMFAEIDVDGIAAYESVHRSTAVSQYADVHCSARYIESRSVLLGEGVKTTVRVQWDA